jgi:hypothetical protein
MAYYISKQKLIEKRKRYLFVITGVLGFITSIFINLLLGISVLAFSLYLGFNWVKFRAKYGIRF